MLLRVKEAFSVPSPKNDGTMVSVPRGALVAPDHPLAKSHGSYMEPATPTVPEWPKKRGRLPRVEQATAAPGEVRAVAPTGDGGE